jgi:hypothetical protein
VTETAALISVSERNNIELFHFDLYRFGVPDFVGLLLNRAVAGKFPHIGNVQDRHFGPAGLVLIDFRHPLQTVNVGIKIG